MVYHSLRALIASALLLLVGNVPVLGQSSDDSVAVASLVPRHGAEVEIRRGAKTILVTKPADLFHGDKVQAGPEGYALIIYDAPQPFHQEVRGGAGPVLIDSTSQEVPPEVPESSSDLWGALRRMLTRLTGGEVKGPAEPVQGGDRGPGDAPPALVLPESSWMLDRQPTIAWWPSTGGNAPAIYHLSVVGHVDSAQCWKGGDVLWETSTRDTMLVYADEAPALAPGTTYRVEVWTSGRGGDFACLEVAGEEEQAQLLEDRALLNRSIAILDPETRDVLWAGMLIEQGYHSDALSLLFNLLHAHPDHTSAREVWNFLLRQTVP